MRYTKVNILRDLMSIPCTGNNVIHHMKFVNMHDMSYVYVWGGGFPEQNWDEHCTVLNGRSLFYLEILPQFEYERPNPKTE